MHTNSKRFLAGAHVILIGGVLSVQGCSMSRDSARAETNQPASMQVQVPETPKGDQMLKIGELSPDFRVKSSSGKLLERRALQGKHVLVYFYPKDDTPGCTKEACAIRDQWKQFEEQGIAVIGVSTDDDESHQAFAEKYKLPFPLVADQHGELAKQFGVPMMGTMSSRWSFLIDPGGKIKKIYPQVVPASHAEEILRDAKNG